MKTIFRMLSVLLLTTGLLSSCIQIGEGIQPSKKLITRDYKVKEFNKIDAGTVGNIYYTQSTDGKTDLQIYGPDNIVACLLYTSINRFITHAQIFLEKVRVYNRTGNTHRNTAHRQIRFATHCGYSPVSYTHLIPAL